MPQVPKPSPEDVEGDPQLPTVTARRMNWNDIFNFFVFQAALSGILFNTQASMLNGPAITRPIQLLLTVGMLSELFAALAALAALYVLLQPRAGITAKWFTAASAILVAFGILSLAAVIVLHTVQTFES